MNDLPTVTVPSSLAVRGLDATAHVINRLDELTEGGTLLFETGEYHFYPDRARVGFFAPGGSSGKKNVCFPIWDMKNITIDGGGSVFVFHGNAFPFIVSESAHITLRNFVCDTALSPTVALEVIEKTEEGFFCRIDKEKSPFRTENGHLIFDREGQMLSTEAGRFSLHSLDRLAIVYLYAGDTAQSKDNLPAPFIDTDAFELTDRLYFRYREGSPILYPYEIGERVVINTEEKRERAVFFFENSEDVTVENVTIRRGGGMGVLAQLCRDVRVRGMRTDLTAHGDGVALTADAFHIIHCSGDFEIADCAMESFLDDACNVHGLYTVFDHVNGDCMHVHLGHIGHSCFCPYKAGDTLVVLNNETMEPVCEARVRDVFFTSNDGMNLSVKVEFLYGEDALKEGFLVENPARMPNVFIHNNRFRDFPHFRLSGAGDIRFEDNEISDCFMALLLMDLSAYWYESGRIHNARICRNRFTNCNALDGDAFIRIGVSGFDDTHAPRIHEYIEISDNRFDGLKSMAVRACGVRSLVCKDNTVDGRPLADEKVLNV